MVKDKVEVVVRDVVRIRIRVTVKIINYRGSIR
jgi:hypothetical protein